MLSGSGGLRVLELRLKGSSSSYVAIEWPQGSSVELLMLRAKEAFDTSACDDTVLALEDSTGCSVAISSALPSGRYEAVMRQCNRSITSIVQQKQQKKNNRGEQEGGTALTGFERDLLQNVIADTLIANERTWLAWTRTSLNIVTCCFTFLFLNEWSGVAVITKLMSNVVVVAFAFAFMGCFITGYVRYRMFTKSIKRSGVSSDYRDLELSSSDDRNLLTTWVYFLAFLLAFSSVLFIGVVRDDVSAANSNYVSDRRLVARELS